MLALPVETRDGLLVIRDDDGVRAYAALSRPRIARRPDGARRIRLVRWTTTDGGESVVGGRLTLDAEVMPTAAELSAAGLGPPRMTLPMPWLDASVRLEGPQFEAVEAEASVTAGMASMAVDLSPATAALLAPLLQADAISPLQVTWTGHVLVRLPPVEIIATADVDEVRRRTVIAGANKRVVINRSIIDANARIEIRGAGNEALEAALREWVLDELADRFAHGKNLSIRVAAADVVRWPLHLATTLDDLGGAADRASMVETVLLDSSALGRVPPIEVRALGDFAGSLERVDVRLSASSGARTEEIACTDDTPRRVGLGTLDFRWDHRIKRKDQPVGDWSAPADVHGSSSVLIPVPVPEARRLEVIAVGLDFTTRWTSVHVTLTHDGASHVVELAASRTSDVWIRPFDEAPSRATARAVFHSRQGQTVDQDLGEVTGNQVVVSDPFDSYRIRVSIVPAGTGWIDAAIVLVDLRYTDAAVSVDETVELTSLDDFVEWDAPARPDGPRRIEWRRHVCYRDGRFHSSEWHSAEAGAIVVRLDGVPQRHVQLLPIYFEPTVASAATVRLHSGSQTETVEIADRTARTINLPPGPFTWTLAWTLPDGTRLPELPAVAGDDVIVVPRFAGA